MIRSLFWGIETGAVLSVLVSFVGGFLAGWLFALTGQGKRKRLSLPRFEGLPTHPEREALPPSRRAVKGSFR